VSELEKTLLKTETFSLFYVWAFLNLLTRFSGISTASSLKRFMHIFSALFWRQGKD